MLTPTRRAIITSSLIGTSRLWAQANDRVRVAIAGLGGRGNELAKEISSLPNVEIATLIDPDGRRTEEAAQKIFQRTGRRPKLETDLRRALDDKSIDGLTIATTNHWHALAAIWACQAGKDVYVEKPISHNIFEGVKLVEAARKYKRVVQGGTQRRSMGRFRKAVEILHGGEIGEIYQAKWTFVGPRESIGFKPKGPPPSWLNWDLWLGPAPMQEYHENLVHYNWHWFWDFGNGELGNNGIHLVDISRWGMNKGLPVKVSSSGGRFGYKDQAETPNTQNITYTYSDGSIMIGEIRGLYTNEPMSWDFWGTKGHMHIFQNGKLQITLGRNKKPEPEVEPLPEIDHYDNFAKAIHSRKIETLNAEIEQTHLSTALCHLGNIAYRMGRELKFDPTAVKFVNDTEADGLLRRNYRAPYIVPDKV